MHTRDEAWATLEHGFKAFLDCLGHLTEDELTSTKVVGKWTVKDTVAHVWSWVDEASKTAKAWRSKRPWQEGVTYDDAWNERQVEDRADLLLIPVVDGLTSAHRRLSHLLDLAEEAEFGAARQGAWGEEMPLVDFFYRDGGALSGACGRSEAISGEVSELRIAGCEAAFFIGAGRGFSFCRPFISGRSSHRVL